MTEKIKKPKKKIKREKKVSEKKVKVLADLVKLIETNNTIMIASIRNLPDKQLQAIKKEMRGKAEIRLIKKKIALMALEKENMKDLEKYIQEGTILIFSQHDPFELSLIFSEKKNAVRARTGQTAEEDIHAEEGLTELVPGPIISELNNAKIKFAIQDGKISIRERSVIAKKGDVLTEEKVSIMAKLDIKPFYVGLVPIAAYDKKSGKFYENIKINKKELLDDLKLQSGKSLALAVKISYACKETIKLLLAKAQSHMQAIEKLNKINTQN